MDDLKLGLRREKLEATAASADWKSKSVKKRKERREGDVCETHCANVMHFSGELANKKSCEIKHQ